MSKISSILFSLTLLPLLTIFIYIPAQNSYAVQVEAVAPQAIGEPAQVFNFPEIDREWQGIQTDLEEQLLVAAKKDPHTFITMGIKMRRIVDPVAMDQILTKANIPRKERVVYVAQAVKKIAQVEQKDLLAYLDQLEKQSLAKNIVSLPISNTIYVDTSAEIAKKISVREDIAYLHSNKEMPLPPPDKSEEGQDTPKTTNWGLNAIGAQTAWGMGYNGTGMVVSNIDNGVRYTHQQLNDTWRSTNGWYDPYLNTTTPYPGNHGTQVMGIMSGENDGSGHTIGIAPASQWIACRIGGDTGYLYLNFAEACANWMVLTSHPDVVNNSWGSSGTSCDNNFKDDIAIMKSAGIFVAIAAGNEGFDSDPANNDGAFSVGSTDSSGNNMPGSGEGPSTCTGYLFPSVCAPGVSTYTCSSSSNTTYEYFNGTSAASPHAAGAAALVMQAHPTWTINQVEEALMFNGEDLGDPGFDITFGTGEVYIPDAINHTASTLTVTPKNVHLCPPGLGTNYENVTCSGYTGSLSWYSYDTSTVTVTPISANTARLDSVSGGYCFVTVTDSAGKWGWVLVSINCQNGTDFPAECTGITVTPSLVNNLCYQGTGSFYQQQFTANGSGNYYWQVVGNKWWVGSIDQTGLFTAHTPNEGSNYAQIRCTDQVWECEDLAAVWVQDCCDELVVTPDNVALTTDPYSECMPTQVQLVVTGTSETIHYQSTKPSVATVTATGLVHAVSGGSCQINIWTYTYCNTAASITVYDENYAPLNYWQLIIFGGCTAAICLILLSLGFITIRRIKPIS